MSSPTPLTKTIPVDEMATGMNGVIRALTGGREFSRRLANLGFTAGAAIAVRQNTGRGPVLLALRGALVALGRAEAAKVLVQVGV